MNAIAPREVLHAASARQAAILRRMLRWLQDLLPHGGALTDDRWRRRHRAITGLAVAHVPAVSIYAQLSGYSVVRTLPGIAAIVLAFTLATVTRDRRIAEIAGTAAWLAASTIVGQMFGGDLEVHLHFFILLGVISIYQSWSAFLLAIAFEFTHHAISMWAADPRIFSVPHAAIHPLRWTLLHVAYLTAAAVIHGVAWKSNERAHQEAESSYRRLAQGQHALVLELQAAQQAKDNLLATVSHEFRTPLTAILGFSKVMLGCHGDLAPDQVEQYLSRIVANGHRLERLISNLTEIQTTPRGPRQPVDLAQATSEAINDVVAIHGTTRPWIHAIPAGMQVNADPTSLQHILVNLLDNAEKYGASGTEVMIDADRRSDRSIAFSVTNTASPIPASERERIFEPFVQSDSSSTRQVGGVGFGLYLVRRLLRTHGGDITVTCGDGTVTFTAVLPAAQHSSHTAGGSWMTHTGAHTNREGTHLLSESH